jgi:putative transposase
MLAVRQKKGGPDAQGCPVRLIFGPGQENDAKRGDELIDGLKAYAFLGDKGYDSNTLRDKIKAHGAVVVIPPRRNRKIQIDYDKILYKERNAVERFFNKLTHFRRVATRYEKLLAAIAIWLRQLIPYQNLGQGRVALAANRSRKSKVLLSMTRFGAGHAARKAPLPSRAPL